MAIGNLKECYKIINSQNHLINAFTHISPISEQSKIKSSGKLAGLPIAIKANIATVELFTTAGSKMLENFKAPYDATVIKLLKEEGAFIIGKTNMDEFGMGSLNIHSFHGPVINPRYPLDEKRSAGGSSGGSAAAVAMGACFAALGSDTGGSVRLPAAFCKVVGFKPSYGLISRWGLIAYASSLDTIGILAKTVQDVKRVFDVIKLQDSKDSNSWTNSQESTQINDLKGIRIGVPKEYNFHGISDKVMAAWSDALISLEARGAKVISVSLPNTKYALASYYTIAPAEAYSNLARYDGARYGLKFPGSYSEIRDLGFGKEVKKRIKIGESVLQAKAYNSYFLQAQNVRKFIKDDFENVFNLKNSGVHILITPVCTQDIPPKIDEENAEENFEYSNDIMTVPASLAGVPALVMPFGEEQVGLQLIGPVGKDDFVLNFGRILS